MTFSQHRTMHRMLQWLRQEKVIVVLLLILFGVISLTSVQHLALTYDEPKHYRYGTQILQGNSDRFDDSKMPFSALNAFPKWVAVQLSYGNLRALLKSTTTARMVTTLFSMGFAWLVYRWSKSLYGTTAALLTLFLYSWDPNIIAHSQLITTDLYALGTITLAVYALWRFSQKRDWKHLTFFAIALGLSQLAKYTAIFLYPLSAILLLVCDLPDLYSAGISRLFVALGKYVLWGIYSLAISILIINAGFLFNRPLMQLGEINFKSDAFLMVQTRFSALKDVPIPLPQPYLRGLDLVRYNERTGKGHANIYLYGQFRKEGFKGYYLAAYLFKVPLAEQALLLLAILFYFRRRQFRSFLQNELFLWGPILFFSVYFNFFYRAQIGIRLYLVVFPFIHIFTGSFVKEWASFSSKNKMATGMLAAYMVISVLSYYPHYIPYFNELVPDRRMAYRVLADSNLDWGQGSWYVRQYRRDHPKAQVNPDGPVAGKVVVSVNNLVGITAEPEKYRWLRENFRPVDTVAYAHLVYQIDESELIHLGLFGQPHTSIPPFRVK